MPAVDPGLRERPRGHVLSTGQNSHCVRADRGQRNAMFRFNSRVPLVRSSSETTVDCERRPSHLIKLQKDY